jgi:hypothetical protein
MDSYCETDIKFRKCQIAWSNKSKKFDVPLHFDGTECARLLCHWDALVDIAIPLDFNSDFNNQV